MSPVGTGEPRRWISRAAIIRWLEDGFRPRLTRLGPLSNADDDFAVAHVAELLGPLGVDVIDERDEIIEHFCRGLEKGSRRRSRSDYVVALDVTPEFEEKLDAFLEQVERRLEEHGISL